MLLTIAAYDFPETLPPPRVFEVCFLISEDRLPPDDRLIPEDTLDPLPLGEYSFLDFVPEVL